MAGIGALSGPRLTPLTSSPQTQGSGGGKSHKGFDPSTTINQGQWQHNRDGWMPKDGNLVASGNTSHAQVEGNESSKYISAELDALEYKVGTGFSEVGTGAAFEASLAELQADAKFRAGFSGVTLGAGAEANIASLRGDIGFGHDLGDIVEGKAYLGTHGEMLVGSNVDANFKLGLNPFKGQGLGVKGEVGGLIGAEASATLAGELGALKGSATAGAIAGLAAAAGGELSLEKGKLSFGINAKLALGIGLSLKFKGSVDFVKAFNTVMNLIDRDKSLRTEFMNTAHAVRDTVKNGVTDVANTVKDGVTTAANTVKDGVTTAANTVKDGVTTAAKSVGNFFKKLF